MYLMDFSREVDNFQFVAMFKKARYKREYITGPDSIFLLSFDTVA